MYCRVCLYQYFEDSARELHENGMGSIVSLRARELLDSRGVPTLETEVLLDCGARARASVPSGASKGAFEALELRDGDASRYGGKGVLSSIEHVEGEISSLLCGFDAQDQLGIDAALCALDEQGGIEASKPMDKSTADTLPSPPRPFLRPKSYLGAQACLSVSWAVARAASYSLGVPLYRHLGGVRASRLPTPLMNVLNGGAHASNDLDIQEFMIIPHGASDFPEALRMGAEVYAALRSCLTSAGHSSALGDEGGFAPALGSTRAALDLVMEAIGSAGLSGGADISLGLDCAASEYYDVSSGCYRFDGEERDLDETISYLRTLVADYPIISLEDPLGQEDWEGWTRLASILSSSVQLVGDDLFATNIERLRRGIRESSCTALLLKPNQIGTLSEALSCGELALRSGFGCIVSHRSGDTEDTSIADLSVALNCGQIKTGGLARSERVSKYNRLLRIAEELGVEASYGCADLSSKAKIWQSR